jgi:hypothetical protein
VAQPGIDDVRRGEVTASHPHPRQGAVPGSMPPGWQVSFDHGSDRREGPSVWPPATQSGRWIRTPPALTATARWVASPAAQNVPASHANQNADVVNADVVGGGMRRPTAPPDRDRARRPQPQSVPPENRAAVVAGMNPTGYRARQVSIRTVDSGGAFRAALASPAHSRPGAPSRSTCVSAPPIGPPPHPTPAPLPARYPGVPPGRRSVDAGGSGAA